MQTFGKGQSSLLCKDNLVSLKVAVCQFHNSGVIRHHSVQLSQVLLPFYFFLRTEKCALFTEWKRKWNSRGNVKVCSSYWLAKMGLPCWLWPLVLPPSNFKGLARRGGVWALPWCFVTTCKETIPLSSLFICNGEKEQIDSICSSIIITECLWMSLILSLFTQVLPQGLTLKF